MSIICQLLSTLSCIKDTQRRWILRLYYVFYQLPASSHPSSYFFESSLLLFLCDIYSFEYLLFSTLISLAICKSIDFLQLILHFLVPFYFAGSFSFSIILWHLLFFAILSVPSSYHSLFLLDSHSIFTVASLLGPSFGHFVRVPFFCCCSHWSSPKHGTSSVKVSVSIPWKVSWWSWTNEIEVSIDFFFCNELENIYERLPFSFHTKTITRNSVIEK